MAEEERLTKAERRKRKREQRKREEAEQARRERRRTIITGLTSVVVVGLVGLVVWQALAGGSDEIEEAVELSATQVTDAREAAGCEVVDQRTQFARDHFDSEAAAPPPDRLYAVRPSHGGSHTGSTHPLVDSSSSQLSELSTTHNLEHGAVTVWYDPEMVSGDTVGAMEAWSERLNDSGFASQRGAAGVFVAPFTDPGLTDGTGVAMRAWGIAIDCDSWNETAANGFVLQYFGTHGIAPEASLGPFPEGTLAWDGDPLPGGFEGAQPDEPLPDQHTPTPSPTATG